MATAGAGAGGMGPAGCGLTAAAFCDTFDAPAPRRGRAGELDPLRWSLSRGEPQLPTGLGAVFGIGAATLPACRAGLPAQVFPDQDSLICDPSADIQSSHWLAAVGAQNYGQNSYRIRQPFDFTARTGKIVFDAEGYVLNGLFGWNSLEVTEDPTPIPSYSLGPATNNEGGAVPRRGFEVHFNGTCGGSPPTGFVLGMIDVLEDYKDTVFTPDQPICVPAQKGKLNHFEIDVSSQKIAVYVSPFSPDGVTFDPPMLVYSAAVDLPFSRGYVQLTTHNHATIKYSTVGGFGSDGLIDAWITHWDNVGFDGPVVGGFREYEIGDSLVPGAMSWNIAAPVMSVGYTVADAAQGPNATLHFHDVDTTGIAGARLAVASWYLLDDSMNAGYVLQYRLNGNPWHDRVFTPGELAVLSNTFEQGAIGQMLDIPTSELVDGDNTLEFQAENIPQNYPPALSSIDLVLTTK